MSALGQKQTFRTAISMSLYPRKRTLIDVVASNVGFEIFRRRRLPRHFTSHP